MKTIFINFQKYEWCKIENSDFSPVEVSNSDFNKLTNGTHIINFNVSSEEGITLSDKGDEFRDFSENGIREREIERKNWVESMIDVVDLSEMDTETYVQLDFLGKYFYRNGEFPERDELVSKYGKAAAYIDGKIQAGQINGMIPPKLGLKEFYDSL